MELFVVPALELKRESRPYYIKGARDRPYVPVSPQTIQTEREHLLALVHGGSAGNKAPMKKFCHRRRLKNSRNRHPGLLLAGVQSTWKTLDSGSKTLPE